jgi:hypothetical protein
MNREENIQKFKETLAEAITAYDNKDDHTALAKLIWTIGWLGDATTLSNVNFEEMPCGKFIKEQIEWQKKTTEELKRLMELAKTLQH